MPVSGTNNRKIAAGPAPGVGNGPKPATTAAAAKRLTGAAYWDHRVLTGGARLPVERAVLDDPTYHNKITMHDGADESMQALLDAIKNAKSSFYVETFIWHNDEAGRKVAQALIDRKKQAEAQGQPFEVKVLIDYSGQHDPSATTNDMKIIDFMKQNGLDVRVFNQKVVNPLATGLTPITHRKLYIQDGSMFMTGGRNIGDEYLMSTFFDPRGKQVSAWHDLLYSVEGDETGRVLDDFFTNWVRSGGKMPATRPTVVPSKDGTAWVQTFTTNPLDHTHGIEDSQVAAIGAARQQIRVIYPYFSDDALIQALIDAKKRNPKLDIKVMLPGKDEGGASGFIYSKLNDITATRLIEAGIEVRKISAYHDGRTLATTFSHLKAMVIDNKVLSVGSANGDARTMHDNHELNTMIYDPATAQKYTREVLDDDWNMAKPVTLQQLQATPWYNRLIGWVLERFAFLF